MFDPKLYREACGELTAPQDKVEEILAMTKHTNRKHARPLRAAVIAAAAVALMVVGVSAAQVEEVQELFYQIIASVKVGQFRTDLTLEGGDQVTVLEPPDTRVENRDGRAILVVDEKEIDITDALEQDGRYTYEYADEGGQLSILVMGSAEHWELQTTMKASDGDGGQLSIPVTGSGEYWELQTTEGTPDSEGCTYTFSSEGGDVAISEGLPTGADLDAADGGNTSVSIFHYDGETVEPLP